MKKIAMALGGMILVLSMGCADWRNIGGKSLIDDPNRMSIPEAKAGADWPKDDWWTAYGDEQLNRLVREGLDHSPTLKTAEARIRRSAAVAGVTGSQLYPQLDGSAQAVRQRFTENGLYPSPIAGDIMTYSRLALDGRYTLDLWGGKRAEFQAALGEARAAEIDMQAARQDLAAAIARTYVRLAAEWDLLDIGNDMLRQRQGIKTLSDTLLAQGLATDIENRQAAAAVASAQSETAGSEERIALLKLQLAALVGAGPDRGRAISRPKLVAPEKAGLPTVIPAELIGRRPEIVALRWRIESAQHGVEAARTQFYPNIDLSLFAGFESLSLGDLLKSGSRMAGIGPAVTLPLFSGGRLRGTLARAYADRDIVIEQYNAAVLSALQEVAGQLASWRSNQAVLEKEQRAVTDLEQVYKSVELRYRLGLVSYLSVLSVEGDLLAQRRKEAEASHRRTDISIVLAHALGGGFAPRNVPVLQNLTQAAAGPR